MPSLLDEPGWTMLCNGKKTGYAVRRKATDDDLTVMETLQAVSMGAGVLLTAGRRGGGGRPGDVPARLLRPLLHFIGSRDSESLYMIAPHGGTTGPSSPCSSSASDPRSAMGVRACIRMGMATHARR